MHNPDCQDCQAQANCAGPKQARLDFEQSLRVNPNGMAAFFSRGACLMQLGDLKAAETLFKEGQSRFPQERATPRKYLGFVRSVRNQS